MSYALKVYSVFGSQFLHYKILIICKISLMDHTADVIILMAAYEIAVLNNSV